MTNERPDPGEMIQRIAESERRRSGKLRIFFGMAAGVGKTYAMLREARALREQGKDLVIAWVESHGRAETDAFLEGMERVPPRIVDYRGVQFAELDLDALRRRAPELALVDELAHTNAPGMRHPKRWEDVIELLDAGISVWTTVNIQHLESMADSVELFTLVPIRERVPDSVFDRADEMQMIDIPPEELIKRLEAGKVYTGPASVDAVRNFFTKENLGVLREIALRQASQLASNQLAETLRGDPSHTPATAGQRILVAVSPSPNSQGLIRWARRLAYSIKADWDCVSIETGAVLAESDKAQLAENFVLARNLGARVSTVPNADVVEGLLRFARDIGSSMLVVGKSGLSRGNAPFAARSLTERLVRESGNLPVFMVQELPLKAPLRSRVAAKLESTPSWEYVAAIAAIAAVTGLNLIVTAIAGYWAASVPFLAAISMLALFLDRRPVLLAAALSALIWDFIFIPPRFTLFVYKAEDILMLALYFFVAVTAGWMTGRLRANERMLVQRERSLTALGSLASELAGTGDVGVIIERGQGALGKAFDAQVLAILADADGGLRRDPEGGWMPLDEKTMSAARYCFTTGQSAGRFTSTLPVVEWHFVPMESPSGIKGVIGLRPAIGSAWSDALEALLRTMARTISIAVEREFLSEANAANMLARESERLGKLLIDSVSHELRTPLTVIQGAASALEDGDTERDSVARAALLAEIKSATGRLNGIVENLLSMSRLESGSLRLQIVEADPEDLVSAAIEAAAEDLAGHGLRISADPGSDCPISCDAALIVQVLANLLRNAVRYGGAAAMIEVAYRCGQTGIDIAVRDDGPGVPEESLSRLFDKFYRAGRAQPGGTGLGLAICKGIVAAHGGAIRARNRMEGGFEVEFTLPLGAKGRQT